MAEVMANRLKGAGSRAAILNNLDDEIAAANKMRLARADGNSSPFNKGGQGDLKVGSSEAPSLRERKLLAMQEAARLKERAKENIEEKIFAPAKQGTNWLLRWAWGALIPSFGLTLIYINLHVFLHWVLGDKFFCKLGEEWAPKEVQAVGGEAVKTVGKAAGLAEGVVLAILDLAALFIILGALALISMIITWATNPAKALEVIWNLGWNTFVPALVNLFKDLL